METLRRCPDLQQRIERELGREQFVNQDMSRSVLDRIARSLGVNPAVANLFVLPEHLISKQAYLLLIHNRLLEFQQIDIQSALDRAEDDAFADELREFREVPIDTGFSSMMNQMSQWQVNNGAKPREVEVEEGKDTDAENGSGSDSESESESEDKPARKSTRADSDSGSESSSGDDSGGDNENENTDSGTKGSPEEFCTGLMENRTKMNQFTKEMYALVNPRNEIKVDINNSAPLIEHLVGQGFDADRLHQITSRLVRSEFAHLRDLNYVHFCIFVGHVLQRYSVS
jgi:hypothetical protein